MNSRVPPPFGLLETGPAPGAAELAAVLLHGRGGTAQQMIELAKRLDIDRARWLAPAAEGGSWYPNNSCPRPAAFTAAETNR